MAGGVRMTFSGPLSGEEERTEENRGLNRPARKAIAKLFLPQGRAFQCDPAQQVEYFKHD
jgi:hypothetical protein